MKIKVKHPKVDPVVIRQDGSIVNTVEWYEDVIDLRTFRERVASSFDLDVIIQRDPNWTDEMKAQLIHSIMNGTPIGYCLLCEKPMNVAHKNVIDFKNRSIAIIDFWDNKFSIDVHLVQEDESVISKRMTWGEICESPEPQLQNIKEKFQNYKIHCVVYKGMNLVQQAKMFLTTNTNMPMRNEELLYGYHFWSKGFCRLAHEIILGKLIEHTKAKQEKDNIKEKGTIFIHRMMYTCFGPELDDVWAVRDVGNSKTKPFVKAAGRLNVKLAKLIDEKNIGRLDQDFMKSTPYWDNIKLMKQCCDRLYDVLKYNNPAKKNLLKNDMFDCVIFFMKKIREEKLTISMMDDFPELYFNVIKSYVQKKSEDPTLTGQSVTIKRISERVNLFEKVWESLVKDDGYKRQKPTASEISLAYLNSGAECPVTDELFDEENTRMEHGDSKSKFSETDFHIASKRGNRWKSNRTVEENEKVLKYQKAVRAS